MDSQPLLSVKTKTKTKTKTKAKAGAKANPKTKHETSIMQRPGPNATNHKCINVCRDAKF
jgi:hypothetical protein